MKLEITSGFAKINKFVFGLILVIMQLIFSKEKITDSERFIRRCGYGKHRARNGEVSYTRHLDKDMYPRFHVYIKEKPGEIIFNLHLDQRAPVCKGVTAHAGEYDGAVLQKEADRIKKIVT